MQFIEVIEAIVKDHPLIDFNRKYKGGLEEYWCLCPCGFSTRHFKTEKSAHRDFKKHIIEEVNEELIEKNILKLNSSEPPARGPALPPLG